MPIHRIVSGGQTGADRGGLDAALAAGVDHGGWCPQGRRAEDGRIPGRYRLRETRGGDYAERTDRNVRDSDGTVIFTHGRPVGGSSLTGARARIRGKPLLHLDLDLVSPDQAASRLADFVAEFRIEVLNVAGSRESQSPGLAAEVAAVVGRVLTGEVVAADRDPGGGA